MPTKKRRHTCMYCGRKLTEDNMENTFRIHQYFPRRYRWKCAKVVKNMGYDCPGLIDTSSKTKCPL